MYANGLSGLYAITDELLMPASSFIAMAEQALRGGAAVIQYRDKSSDQAKRLQQASELKQLCDQHDALLIINDDVNLAKTTGAHGVHLGEHDMEFYDARDALGEEAIIGVSCYANFERAKIFSQMGANYIAFGAFYASPTKPDAAKASLALLNRARDELAVPVCAIGGISIENAPPLIEAGADMTAVISNLFAAENIEECAARFAALW